MIYIYKITNTINGKIYIGQTLDFHHRLIAHKSLSNKQNPIQYIHRAMKKYGFNNFIMEHIVSSLDQINADMVESKLIEQYNSRDPNVEYNIAPGGGGAGSGKDHPCFGKKQSLELIEKRVSPLRGKPRSEEVKEKIRQKLLGKKHTNERKINQSKSHIGQVPWNKGTKGICKPNSGSFKPKK